MLIRIHINPALAHQIQHGMLLLAGFKKHGLDAKVTSDPQEKADIHVVSGPHFAKHFWLDHPNTILLDRCYYRGNPEHVSFGWLNNQGSRDFIVGAGRPRPGILDNASGDKTIFLADYQGAIEDADTVRLHPLDGKYDKSLLESLREHKFAIGYNTTALVTAAIEGLNVTCLSKNSIMSQENWLDLLPYADWHMSEIESGELWDHLRLSLNRL